LKEVTEITEDDPGVHRAILEELDHALVESPTR
jgi:hypothetical protein